MLRVRVNYMKDLKEKQAIVYYLGHSGWAVKTQNYFLIFDYFESKKKVDYKSIADGYINPAEIKDEKIFVFVSHRHPDHYDKIIHHWKEEVPDISYIAGWKSRTDKFIPLPPHSDIKLDGLEISTLKSTDEGVGFSVKADGLIIFHAGDHASWDDEPEALYNSEIDYISEKTNNVDIAFLPVTKYSGVRPKCMTDGAVYAIKMLKAKAVFPMHGNRKEFLYKEFAHDVKKEGFNIVCAEKPGDGYLYKNGVVENI